MVPDLVEVRFCSGGNSGRKMSQLMERRTAGEAAMRLRSPGGILSCSWLV